MSSYNNDNWSLVRQVDVGHNSHMSHETLMGILGRTE